MRHPIQPVIRASDGVARFKENEIVRFLLDNGPFGLNALAGMPFTNADREQFAQLIGYSLSGFSELSYVSDETFNAATIMHEAGKTAAEARIEAMEAMLAQARDGVRNAAVALFQIHPDDLQP